MTTSVYSIVLDRPADEVWDVVRDFNSYPIWVNGVTESHLEDGLSGTAVGAIRNFSMGGGRTRQRLLAHSDVDRYFTYAGCDPFELESGGRPRLISTYEGTLQVRSIAEGDRCLAEWSARYECPSADQGYWSTWWAESLPVWLDSLRGYLDRTPSPAGR